MTRPTLVLLVVFSSLLLACGPGDAEGELTVGRAELLGASTGEMGTNTGAAEKQPDAGAGGGPYLKYELKNTLVTSY